MSMFDSTKASLNDLLREIKEGKIQLPDFQPPLFRPGRASGGFQQAVVHSGDRCSWIHRFIAGP